MNSGTLLQQEDHRILRQYYYYHKPGSPCLENVRHYNLQYTRHQENFEVAYLLRDFESVVVQMSMYNVITPQIHSIYLCTCQYS